MIRSTALGSVLLDMPVESCKMKEKSYFWHDQIQHKCNEYRDSIFERRLLFAFEGTVATHVQVDVVMGKASVLQKKAFKS